MPASVLPTDLCTIADVKEMLGNITGTGSDDKLQRLVNSQSLRIARYCGRTFGNGTQVYTETRDGSGTPKMLLRKWPATAVTSVTANGVLISQSVNNGAGWVASVWDGVSFPIPACFVALTSGGAWPSLNGPVQQLPGSFPPGQQNVVIVYSAGFATVPFDLNQAAVELVMQAYKQTDRVGQKSVTAAQQTMSYQLDMLPSVKDALSPYVNRVPV